MSYKDQTEWQLQLPIFSKWHFCLDLAQYPARVEPCSAVNYELWCLWCEMKCRPVDDYWGIWTEKDVVDWVNSKISEEKETRNGI